MDRQLKWICAAAVGYAVRMGRNRHRIELKGSAMSRPALRRQADYVALTKEQFRERFFARFYDPAFEEVASELEKVFEKEADPLGRLPRA
jgi:hypothetical protein